MKLRVRVSSDQKQLLIQVNQINVKDIMENARGYYVNLALKKIQLKIEISSVYAREMEEGIVKHRQFLLKKNEHETFLVRITLDIEEAFQRIQNNRMQVLVDESEGIQVTGFLAISKKQLEPYIERTKIEDIPIIKESSKNIATTNPPPTYHKKWNQIRWQNDRKRTYPALYYKFNKSMNRHAEKQKRFGVGRNLKVDPAALRRKGIYHDEFADNRCDNCYYFRGDLCSLHLVTVTVDYACFKHRGFREIQGGAFSPK